MSIRRDENGPIDFAISGNYAQRKRRGLFFTPWPIARRLAEALIPHIEDDVLRRGPAICDPFVGAGILLAALVESLVPACEQRCSLPAGTARDRLLANVYGTDIDEGVLELATRALAPVAGGVSPSPVPTFRVADALVMPLQDHEYKRESVYSGLFPRVFERGGFDVVLTNPPWEKVRVNDREFFGHYLPDFTQRSRIERDRIREELLGRPEVVDAYRAYRARVAALKLASKQHYTTAGGGGDLDTYKLAVERSIQLTRPRGLAGVVVPHGLLGDWGARRLRRWLVSNYQILEIRRLETGPDLFPEIHANLGVIMMIVRKEPPSDRTTILVSGAARRLDELETPKMTAVPLTLVAEATPHVMVPLVDDPCDVELLERCLVFPSLGSWPEAHFKAHREVDMTNDRQHFVPVGSGRPLIEGKHIAPYRVWPEKRRYDVDDSCAGFVAGPRIAWRAVADRAMKRRLVATWIPEGVVLGNSLIFTIAHGPRRYEVLLWLLAWMNSRIADAQLRLWCANNNINIFHLQSCRVPPFEPNAESREIVRLSAGLVAAEFAGDLPRSVRELAEALDDAEARQKAIATIDAIWREIYGLPIDVWDGAVLSRTVSVAV